MLAIPNIAIILACVGLIAFSAANFYFGADGDQTFVQLYKDVGSVMWFGPADSSYRMSQIESNADPVWVWLRIDWTTETVVWVSAAFGMIAGFLGIGGLILDMKRPSRNWTIVSLLVAATTFLCTLVCMILAFVKHDNLESSCSVGRPSRVSTGTTFKCTGELVRCKLMPYITPGIVPVVQGSFCSNARTSRMLLIPLMVFSMLLLTLFGLKTFSVNKDNGAGRKDSRSHNEKIYAAVEGGH